MSTLDEGTIRELFTDAVRRSGAIGAQLSIVRGAERVDLAIGFADVRRGAPMTPDTLMQIGSITKVFNAVIVMALVGEGRLGLDEPIEQYLADVRIADAHAAAEITLRQLLSMSSGLDNGPYLYFGRGDDALRRYVEALGSLPRHFAPGAHFGYSNAGICVAALIASAVTGLTWEGLLRERILAPAGIQRAAITDEDAREQVVSAGHVAGGNDRPPVVEPLFTDLRARAPSGPSFALSTGELARFGAILACDAVSDDGTRLLGTAVLAEMLSPQIATPNKKYGTAWCLGPCTDSWDGQRVWGHGGTSPTATSYLYWVPEQRAAVAFVANTHAAMGELSRSVFEEIVPAAFGIRKPAIDVPDPGPIAADQRRYVGRYEELGMTMDVRSEGEALRAHLVPRSIPGERGVTRAEQDVRLRLLGGDRFLMEPVGGPDRQRGVVDMAFFGEDAGGRATNALNLVFPMSRVPS